MVSEEEKLKQEIRVVKEVIRIQEKKMEVGWSEWSNLEEEVMIPDEYQHLTNYNQDELEEHLERLQSDLEDLQRWSERRYE